MPFDVQTLSNLKRRWLAAGGRRAGCVFFGLGLLPAYTFLMVVWYAAPISTVLIYTGAAIANRLRIGVQFGKGRHP
jgi:hypothetical protein